MNLHSVLPVLIGVVVFVWILYRQLRSQPVGGASGFRRPVVFGVLGLVFGGEYLLANRVSPLAVAGFAVSLAIGVGLAFARAYSVRLWRQDGAWWRRGTALTLVLWFCAIGSHLGIDALVGHLDPSEGLGRGLGNATTLLYLGVALGLQHLVLVRRVRALDAVTTPTRGASALAG